MIIKDSILIISLFILIFIAGCSQTTVQTDTQVESTVQETYKSCSLEDFSKGDAFYFPLFQAQDSANYCRPSQERSCYSDMCYTKYLRYAGWKKDIALCEKLDLAVESSRKDNCFYEVSFFVFDRGICNKISNVALKSACLMSKDGTDGNNVDRALYYAKTWYDRCSSDPTRDYKHNLDKGIVPTQEQIVECQKRVLNYLKANYQKECSDEFCDYFKSFNQDKASCETVPAYRDECLTILMGGAASTANDCEQAPNKANCLYTLAIETEDIGLCLSLADASCIREIAVNQKDIEVCFVDEDAFSPESCVEHYAATVGDVSVCNDNRYMDDVDFCERLAYEQLSSTKQDVSYCYKIQDEEDANWCVAMYAGDFNDASVCSDARFTGDKSHCLSQAG